MANDIGFSGPGAPNIAKGSGGKSIPMPEFFDRSLKVDFEAEGTSMDANYSPREEVLAKDAASNPEESRTKAPRIS
jgi:hypothetical protein